MTDPPCKHCKEWNEKVDRWKNGMTPERLDYYRNAAKANGSLVDCDAFDLIEEIVFLQEENARLNKLIEAWRIDNKQEQRDELRAELDEATDIIHKNEPLKKRKGAKT
jgi:hypothetical protein